MDFDQMLETWRGQNTSPQYEVNRDALRQSLQTEEAKVRGALRLRRRVMWFLWIIGSGMAIWAAFWIAITITNGWPAIYAIASGVSVVLFALGVGGLWASRGREPEPIFGNTLEEEVRRSLALSSASAVCASCSRLSTRADDAPFRRSAASSVVTRTGCPRRSPFEAETWARVPVINR